MVQYITLHGRLYSSPLFRLFQNQSNERRVQALVRATMPSGLEWCDIWVPSASAQIMYINSEEIVSIVGALNAADEPPLMDHHRSRECARGSATVLETFMHRLQALVCGDPKNASEGESSKEDRERHALDLRLILVESGMANDVTVAGQVAKSKGYAHEDALVRFQTFLLDALHERLNRIESMVGVSDQWESSRVPVVNIHTVLDTHSSALFVERIALGTIRCQRDRSIPSNIQRMVSAQTTAIKASTGALDDGWRVNTARLAQALTHVPEIGEKRAASIAHSGRTLTQLCSMTVSELRMDCCDGQRAPAAALHSFLHQPILPSPHTADAVLYADFIKHWHKCFGNSTSRT